MVKKKKSQHDPDVPGVKERLLGNYCPRHKLFLYSAEIIDLIQK